MLKRYSASMVCGIVLTFVIVGALLSPAFAQAPRSIVPYPRDVSVEVVDPETKMPQRTFCIGPNTIDVELTNNSQYRTYVYVMNRNTSGQEQPLYAGWVDPGKHYLSALMNTQFELVGPEGTEMIRVDSGTQGQITPGQWIQYQVRNCGGTFPPGGPGGNAFLWANIYPYAIPQGGKGTISLQTNVTSQTNMTYYFEILNSWGQLWKRLPVTKRPHERYNVTLPVGKTTKPKQLTYTVNLWLEAGFAGQRRKVASTQLTFRVVTAGSEPEPYAPGYPQQTTPGWYSPYGNTTPGLPYVTEPFSPYSQYSYPYPYGYQQMGSQQERAID